MNQSALETWKQKLAHLQQQEAITADPLLKFQLEKQIEECKQKIDALEKNDLERNLANFELKPHKETERESIREFREQVREYLGKRYIEDYENIFLHGSAEDLGLTLEETERILAEEQAPILQAREAYRKRLHALIERGFYPFNPAIENELKKFKERKNLTDWEVREISQPILVEAEKAYQERLRQQRWREIEDQLQRYQMEFEIVKVNQKGAITTREKKKAEYFHEDIGNGIALNMVAIPEGTFLMGSPENEKDSHDVERPQHQVKISPFYMSQTPITQAQWRVIATLPQEGKTLEVEPSYFKGDNLPVERVSWEDAIEFCARLSRHTGRNYRLPSEAEWEYACRARTTTPFHFGETLTYNLANYDARETYQEEAAGEYRDQTTPVKSFPPNAFGLYDMHGNIWEWCLDPWHENYNNVPDDGSVWDEVNNDNRYEDILNNINVLIKDERSHILRGGFWHYNPHECRSAYRRDNGGLINYGGFRAVCIP